MKRSFEENVPKLRPRVRLGQAIDDAFSEAETVAREEAQEGPAPLSQLELARAPEALPGLELLQPARAAQPASAPADERVSAAAVQPLPVPPRPAKRAAAALEVAQLAKELTSELAQAAEANAQLHADLDSALGALRRAAEESRDQRLECERLGAEVEKRAEAARQLLRDIELLEAERDGALGQVARLGRELREDRAKAAAAEREAQAARAEAAQAREHAQRLASELRARTSERDEALAAGEALRAERDGLVGALAAARVEAEEALQSRGALEEIHRALDEARSRVARLR